MINRRQWLETSAWALGANSALVQAWAAPAASGQRLLVVFLRGAYDATSALIPVDSSFYYESRPTIAIAKPGSGEGSAWPLAGGWGLHPALVASVGRLWSAGQCAFVPFSGLDAESRSHFEMQDLIELGLGSRASRMGQKSGFLNRFAAELSGPRIASLTTQLSPILQGSVRVPTIPLMNLSLNKTRPVENSAIARMYEGSDLGATVREGFQVREKVESEMIKDTAKDAAKDMAREMDQSARGAYPAGSFQAIAPRIAKLMVEDFPMAFVDIGHWDTHTAQGGATGQLANKLADLGGGLSLIQNGLGEAWKQTTVVVLSEFGRTFRENGSRGTDHGHGSAMWLAGGNLRGGRIAGEQVASNANTLHEGRDWPVLNDYRAVLAGLFKQTLGLSPAALDRVFPGVQPLSLGLV